MSFITINDWRIPVKACSMQPMEVGTRERAVDGSLSVHRRAVKRSWRVQTAVLPWETANAVWQLVQGRGHIFQFDGSTNPQTTSGTSYLASAAGMMPTNSPTFSIERALAADGSEVKHWRGGSIFSYPSKFNLGGLYVRPTTTNQFATAVRTCSDHTAWTGVNTTTADNGAHYWQGSSSVSLAFDSGSGTRYAYVTTGLSLNGGTDYVWSLYAKSVAGCNLSIKASSTGETLTATVALPANVWTRIFLTFETGFSATYTCEIHAVDAGAHTVYIDGMQFEQKSVAPYSASPWVDGSSTATQGPKYSTKAVNPYDSLTISAWSFGSATLAADNADENICSMTYSSTSKTTVDLYLHGGVPKLQIRGATGVATTSSSDAAITKAVAGWHHLAGTYDYQSGTQKLYVNGTLKDTDTMAVQPILSEITNFSIGSYSLINSEQAWGGVNGVIVLPFAAPSGLVSAMYSRATQWPTLPILDVAGSAIDGVVQCIGNVEDGEFVPAFQSTGYATNNVELSFVLEEV